MSIRRCVLHIVAKIRISLCLLLFLFISVFLFINCLLINTRWYIHFDLDIISTYLILVPLLKDRGLVYDCLFVSHREISVSNKSSCIFNYFVLSTLVFLINFVTLPPFFAKTGPQSDNQVAVIKDGW